MYVKNTSTAKVPVDIACLKTFLILSMYILQGGNGGNRERHIQTLSMASCSVSVFYMTDQHVV